MKRVLLLFLSAGLCATLAVGLGVATGQDKDAKQEDKKPSDKDKDAKDKDKKPKEVDEFGGKSIGEWLKILRDDPMPNRRRAALIVLDVTGRAAGAGLSTVIEVAEKDSDTQVRHDAVALLGRLGPRTNGALRALVHSLRNDKAGEVREAAATGIANRFTEAGTGLPPASEYVSDLTEALKDSHDGTRIAVAGALRNLGISARSAFPALLQAASNPKEHAQVRAAALHVLSRHDDSAGVTAMLIQVAKSDEAPVTLREAAIEGLSRTKAESAEITAALCVPLADKSLELRKSAAAALATLGTKAKSGWDIVKDRLKNEKDSGVRNHLIRLTGAISKESDDALNQLVARAENDDSTENRIAAIQELAGLGLRARSAVPALTKIASEDARAAIRDDASKAVKIISP
jgi:hypothetical protein